MAAGLGIGSAAGRPRCLVLAVTAILVLLSGCSIWADYELYVRNESGQEWFLRTSRGQQDPSVRQVVRIEPGADGVTVAWKGDRDHEIEVLDLTCEHVGVFELLDDGSLVVPGVDGLTGWIEPRGSNLERLTTLEIHDTAECGGFMPM